MPSKSRHSKTSRKSRSHSKSKKNKTKRKSPITIVVHKSTRKSPVKHRATAKRRSPSKYYYDVEAGKHLGKIEVVVHKSSHSNSKKRHTRKRV